MRFKHKKKMQNMMKPPAGAAPNKKKQSIMKLRSIHHPSVSSVVVVEAHVPDETSGELVDPNDLQDLVPLGQEGVESGE